MDAKTYLNQIRFISADIDARRLEYDNLSGVWPSSLIESERVDGGPAKHGDDRFARYVEYGEQINAKIDELVDLKAKISKEIDQVEDYLECSVLRYRYINLLSWGEIAEKLHMGKRQLFRVHEQSLKSFSRKFVTKCH